MRSRVTLIITLILWTTTLRAQPLAERGVIHITGHELEDAQLLRLRGSWEFYWDKILTPTQFNELGSAMEIDVPGVWESEYQALGCGTYRLTVILEKPVTNYSIYFPVINSAAKIWLNGKIAEETGVVSRDLEKYEPRLTGSVVAVPEDTARLEFVIQVANYTYFNGGITGTPYMGRSSTIQRKLGASTGLENFYAGSLIAMFLYQVILFGLYRRGKSYLWLALICLMVALRSVVMHGGSFLLPNMFETVHWEYWKKIEFFSVYATVALLPLYIYDLFRETSKLWPVRIFIAVAITLCACVIVTPQYVYGRLLDVCHASLLLGFVYAIISVATAWKHGQRDAKIIFFGVLASFPFILLEILRNTTFLSLHVPLTHLVELGVLIFLLFQIYLLASNYSRSYKRLETINLDLEEIVSSRTDELHKANEVKDRLLSVMSHDIKSPLNSLRGILDIYNMGGITEEEFGTFVQEIETKLDGTSMLVDNILFWTAAQLKGESSVRTEFDLKTAVEHNIELFKSAAVHKHILLHHALKESMIITFDKDIVNLVLRNLISNAVKFSKQSGEILVSALAQNGEWQITVKDSGVGMTREQRNQILNAQTSVSTAGTTNERGTGLGLSLSYEFLKKAGGDLLVESVPDEGTTFTVIIPKRLST